MISLVKGHDEDLFSKKLALFGILQMVSSCCKLMLFGGKILSNVSLHLLSIPQI